MQKCYAKDMHEYRVMMHDRQTKLGIIGKTTVVHRLAEKQYKDLPEIRAETHWGVVQAVEYNNQALSQNERSIPVGDSAEEQRCFPSQGTKIQEIPCSS